MNDLERRRCPTCGIDSELESSIQPSSEHHLGERGRFLRCRNTECRTEIFHEEQL